VAGRSAPRLSRTGRKKTPQNELRQHVLTGSAILDDELKSYEGPDEFQHEVIDHAVAYINGEAERMDAGVRKMFSVSKEDVLREQAREKQAKHMRKKGSIGVAVYDVRMLKKTISISAALLIACGLSFVGYSLLPGKVYAQYRIGGAGLKKTWGSMRNAYVDPKTEQTRFVFEDAAGTIRIVHIETGPPTIVAELIVEMRRE
jgi:hypothetical protein